MSPPPTPSPFLPPPSISLVHCCSAYFVITAAFLPFLDLRVLFAAGLADLSSFHFVTPSLPRLDKLLGQGFPPEASTLALQLANNDLNLAVTMMEETPLQELMTYRLSLSPRRRHCRS